MINRIIPRVILSIAIVVFASLQWRLWIGEGSISHIRRLNHEAGKQQLINAELTTKNRHLEVKIRDLKHGLDTIEEKSRRDLGMIKKGETFILVVGDEGHDGK